MTMSQRDFLDDLSVSQGHSLRPLIFRFLRSALERSKKPKQGLKILQQALELLKESKEGSDEEALQGPLLFVICILVARISCIYIVYS